MLSSRVLITFVPPLKCLGLGGKGGVRQTCGLEPIHMVSPAWQSQSSQISHVAAQGSCWTECSKRLEWKLQGFLWPSLRNPRVILFTIFYWSSKSLRSRFKGKGISWTSPLSEGNNKELQSLFMWHNEILFQMWFKMNPDKCGNLTLLSLIWGHSLSNHFSDLCHWRILSWF